MRLLYCVSLSGSECFFKMKLYVAKEMNREFGVRTEGYGRAISYFSVIRRRRAVLVYAVGVCWSAMRV